MNAIRAIVRSGRLELQEPVDWPDGTEVLIEPTIAPSEKVGIFPVGRASVPADVEP
ncbi:MAG: hypothetical protein ACLQIB_19440 [Isosphaeraceae bacterium]